MKVYVITEGYYSDYHIIAVSLDKEKAEVIANVFIGNNEGVRIEEYDTDKFELVKPGDKIYEVIYHKLSGEYSVYETYYLGSEDAFNKVCKYPLGVSKPIDEYRVCVLSKDKDHAFKIGVDLINEYKAREEGIAI